MGKTAKKIGGVHSISLKTELGRFLELFNEDRHMHREARIIRLTMELEHLKRSGARRQGVLHASSLYLGGKEPSACMRKLAYSVQYKKSSSTASKPKTLNIFEVGHDAHGKYQGWFAYMFGNSFQAEVPMYLDELNIVGSCDGVFTYPCKEDCKYLLGLEIKTIGQDNFKSLKGPLEDHLDQGTVYMNILGLDGMVFFYENKNNQEIKEYVVSCEQVVERWERIVKRVKHVNTHLENGTLPRRKVERWKCSRCRWSQECQPFTQRHVSGATLAKAFKGRSK